MAAATRFRAPPADALLVHPLDDGLLAIFHRPSATTHLLASPAPELLAALAERWLTADELLAALLADYDLLDADAALLAPRLDELVAAGLVEAA